MLRLHVLAGPPNHLVQVSLLLRVYSGRTPAEIGATDPIFLRDLGLLEALSTNRGNGIAAMVRKVREVAANA